MRAKEFLPEGGWANPVTQNTTITPALVKNVYEKVLPVFIKKLNEHLKSQDLPAVELGRPCGSTTYYERDLLRDPEREYGDIDVNMFIPRIEGMTNNANAEIIKTQIRDFCESSPDFQTSNGTNVIFQVGKDYVQVDLITSYHHNKEWTKALAPEYQVKGVLCNSLYSSLGEALQLSIGSGHGVQAKLQKDKLVPFKTSKDVVLKTITNNPKTWAIDIAKFLGAKKISPTLKKYPGMLDEIRVADIVNSIKGIAESIDDNELVGKVKDIYLKKIQAAINSSKFDKAASAGAIEKANKTKEALASKSAQIASLFDNTPLSEDAAPKVKLEISYTGYSHGQHDGYIIARNEEGLGMGYLDFSIYEGEALIKMVEVKPEYRRLGIGIMLVKRLEQEVGKGNIDWGGLTDDGKELHDKYQQLDEMPLPVDWDPAALGAGKTFKDRLQYALERAKKIGTGSARVAFTIDFEGRPTVLKVAKNNKGLAQNNAELGILDDGYTGQLDIVIPLIDYDKRNPSPIWIQTELAKKVTAKRLAELLHCTDVYEFLDCVYAIVHPRAKPTVPSRLEQTKQRLIANGKSEQDVEKFVDYVDAVVTLLHSSTLEFGDLRQLANWGEYQGRPVIIDLGFTEETKHLYGH
jgi:GNAT superfamily N-acetyltransferase